MRALALFAFVLVLLLETGCPLDDNNKGITCDGGGPTLVQQCNAVYTEYCNQAATRCAISVPSDCAAQATMGHCPCASENCDASSCATADMVATCKQDLDTEDCNLIQTAFTSMGAWPADCQPFMGQP